MQRDIDKEHMVKIISYQKVLAASKAENLPKLGLGHTRMLLTWQGLADLVDMLAGRDAEQQGAAAADLSVEKVLAWLKSAEALPKDQWDTQQAYNGSVPEDGGEEDAT